jgi:hypothetical protein
MRWYSSGFSPCAAMSSGVIGTELEMVMGGDWYPWERGISESPLIASFGAIHPFG